MTDAELDEWIVNQIDVFELMQKMNDAPAGNGVGAMFFVRSMEEQFGMPNYESWPLIRVALMRLLRARRVEAVGINGWATHMTAQTTPERIADRERVLNGLWPFTVDLRNENRFPRPEELDG